jgi:hypothetical protein
MSLSLPQLKCAICDEKIDSRTPFFRASGSFLPANDPLVSYCNAPLHWSCYSRWPQRPAFARRYIEAWVAANRKNPFWWSVYHDSRVYVSANPMPTVEQASVRLYAVGSDIRVPLPRWAEWLANPDSVTPGLHALERNALTEVLPALAGQLPTDHAVVCAIDPREKPAAPRKAARTSEGD